VDGVGCATGIGNDVLQETRGGRHRKRNERKSAGQEGEGAPGAGVQCLDKLREINLFIAYEKGAGVGGGGRKGEKGKKGR